MTDGMGPKLLVTGGSGHLARRVIELLLELGRSPIVTTTRTPEKLADLAARGVDVRRADHDDPASLIDAYAGVERMLVISSDDIGRRAGQVARVVAAAEAAGVRHLCYTSTASARPDLQDEVTSDHFWSELAIMSSGLTWTILRHLMYTEHIYLYLPIAVTTGRLMSAMGDGGRSYVTREDCARADAAALASTSTECRILDITGPASVTQDELAAITSEIVGRPITHVRAAPENAMQDWIAGGLRPDMAKGLLEFDLLARQGYHAMATPAVRELTGREPESVRSYLFRNAADLFPDEHGHARIDVHMARPSASGVEDGGVAG